MNDLKALGSKVRAGSSLVIVVVVVELCGYQHTHVQIEDSSLEVLKAISFISRLVWTDWVVSLRKDRLSKAAHYRKQRKWKILPFTAEIAFRILSALACAISSVQLSNSGGE